MIRTRSLALGAIAAVTLASSAAFADSLEITQTMDWEFPLSPGQQTLSFDQFDDLGGTLILEGVSMSFDGSVSAAVTAENDSSLPSPDFALNMTGFVSVSFGTLDDFAGYNEVFASGGVDATDGVPGSGPDFHDFGTVGDTATGDDSTTTGLGVYIGGGTIDAVVDATGGFSISGSTDSSLTFEDFMSSGTVTIVYKYSLVPAPGALALLGLAGVAGRRRRRA